MPHDARNLAARSSCASLQTQQAVALKLTNDADGAVALKGDTGGAQKSEYSGALGRGQVAPQPCTFSRAGRSGGRFREGDRIHRPDDGDGVRALRSVHVEAQPVVMPPDESKARAHGRLRRRGDGRGLNRASGDRPTAVFDNAGHDLHLNAGERLHPDRRGERLEFFNGTLNRFVNGRPSISGSRPR